MIPLTFICDTLAISDRHLAELALGAAGCILAGAIGTVKALVDWWLR